MLAEFFQKQYGLFHRRHGLKTHQHPYERSLGDRAGREANLPRHKPTKNDFMVNMRLVSQREERIAVQRKHIVLRSARTQNYYSSITERISSSVTGRRERTKGKPVSG
jgi:hypothetical protein